MAAEVPWIFSAFLLEVGPAGVLVTGALYCLMKASSRPYFTDIISRLVPAQINTHFFKHVKQMEYDNNGH